MKLVDTHAHLYLDAFDDDRDEMMQRSVAAGVSMILLPNIDKDSVKDMMALSDAWPGVCFPMMGLHPTSVKEDHREQMMAVEGHLATGNFIAIGEIGIDLYWDTTFRKEQEEVFRRQLALARQYKLPVAIHTRNSMEETLAILDGEISPGGVFHCFSGTPEHARRVTDMGFYLGIGGVLTFKNSALEAVVESMPLETLLLETDAPFLAPMPYRGKRNESAYLRLVAEKVARIKEVPVEEVSGITTANAIKLFGLPS